MNKNTDLVEKETKAQSSRPRCEATRNWKRVLDRRLPDLRVLYSGETVLGFVYKLADTSTGVSQWCCNTGCGDTAKLVGHNWTLDQAKLCVEENIKKPTPVFLSNDDARKANDFRQRVQIID
jgi:hypothetical protein